MGVNLSSEVFLYASYDPISMGVGIKELGGGTKQVYYSDTNQYVPNRKLIPLILVPEIQVVDPEKIIPSGDITSTLVSSRWYVGNISTVTQVATYEDDAGGNNADYALSRTHPSGLIVRKNVEQTSPVALFFQGEYYDSRRGSNVMIALSALLTTTSNAESIAAPVIVLTSPASWIYNPLDGISNQTIQAYMYRAGEQVPAANVAWFWYKVENSVESLINPDEDLFYVSGKNANGTWNSAIVVNPDYMEKVHIRCRADYYEGPRPSVPTQNNMAETIFRRRFPYSLKTDCIIRTGTLVKSNVERIVAECQVSTNAGIINEPEKYFFIKWFVNKMTAGAKDVEIGHGKQTTVDRSVAMGSNSTVRPRIFFKLKDHGAYQALTDENGDVLTDENNNVIVGF